MTYGGGTGDPFGGAPFGQPYGQAPYGGPPMVPAAPPPPSAEVNTFATLSVVFAFLFAPAGAVLGHLGLSQIKRTGQRGRDRALIGVVLSYTFIVLSVVGLVVWVALAHNGSKANSSATTSPADSTPKVSAAPTSMVKPEPKVTSAELRGLLPNLEELRVIMKAPNLSASQVQFGVIDQHGDVTPAECTASLYGMAPEGYAGTDYVSAYATSAEETTAHLVTGQGVVAFADAKAAQEAFARYVDRWRQCSGRELTVPTKSSPMVFNSGPVEDVGGGVTTLLNVSPGSPEVFTFRAIAVKSNVMVDTQFLAWEQRDDHITIARRILDRIPG